MNDRLKLRCGPSFGSSQDEIIEAAIAYLDELSFGRWTDHVLEIKIRLATQTDLDEVMDAD